MPHIIPIRDLKNTGEISQLCHKTNEPIYVTKNGYGDMVIMSMEIFEERLFMQDVYSKLAESEADIAAGHTKNAKKSLQHVREKYHV
jgi:PHD/YefM family antitoxin component YafN of YafNO toxin-antitoxin module